MQDYAKLDFMDFIDSIMPFYDSNVVKRNRQVFNILDIDKDGKIDIISMLQLYRYLPERCLLRYEILLMLDTYKAKNIIQKSASGQTALDFNKFNKIVPQSSISKSCQFAFFGHTIPITSTGTHLVKPINPFEYYTTFNQLKEAVSKTYPVRFGESVPPNLRGDPTLILAAQDKVDFMTDEQYQELFADEFAEDAPHILKKLK